MGKDDKGKRSGPAAESQEASGVLDLVHLARMSVGNRRLEREVLELFLTQSAAIVARMKGERAEMLPMLAHTLKGSAQGIGAFEVAAAASALESACRCGRGATHAIHGIEAALEEVRAAIAVAVEKRSGT